MSFRVDGRVFRAHRVILATRSQYFRALLQNGREQGNALAGEPIDIHGVEAPVFEMVLHFLYTHKAPPITADTEGVSVCSLARAADYLHVTALYQDCLKLFTRSLSLNDVIDDLIEAHDNKLSEFQEAAICFMQDTGFAHIALDSLDKFKARPDLMELSLHVTKALISYQCTNYIHR